MSFLHAGNSHTRTATGIAVALLLGMLAGCSTSPNKVEATTSPAPTEASTSTEATDTDEAFKTPDAAWECGYVSNLSGMLSRTQWLHDQGQLEEADYMARLALIQEGWTTIPPGQSAVTDALRPATSAAVNGIVDNATFDSAVQTATIACDSAGSLVAQMQLPGQGG